MSEKPTLPERPPLPERPNKPRNSELFIQRTSSKSLYNLSMRSHSEDLGQSKNPRNLENVQILSVNKNFVIRCGDAILSENDILWRQFPTACTLCGNLIVCAFSNLIRIFNIENFEINSEITFNEGKVSATASAEFEHESYIYIGTAEGHLLGYDQNFNPVFKNYKVVNSPIIEFIKTEKSILVVAENGQLVGFDPFNASVVKSHKNLLLKPTSIDYSFEHSSVVCASGKSLMLLEMKTENIVKTCLNSFGIINVSSISAVAVGKSLQTLNSIYSGHEDGRILEWELSEKSLKIKKVINFSVYRILDMIFVNDNLWIGMGTGKITEMTVGDSFNTTNEWDAHSKGVMKMEKFGDKVLTLGLHTGPAVWRIKEENPFDLSALEQTGRLSVLVCQWNTDQLKPFERDLSNFYRKVFQNSKFDLLVFTLQEIVDLKSTSNTARSFLTEQDESKGRSWVDSLSAFLGREYGDSYVLLSFSQLIGICTILFIRKDLRSFVFKLHVEHVKTGLSGLHGNKGAIVSRFYLKHTPVCIVNVHLPAGQEQVVNRNADSAHIMKATRLPKSGFIHWNRGDGSYLLDYDCLFFVGDLNYRIDMHRQKLLKLIEEKRFTELLLHDQLEVAKKDENFVLARFNEMQIQFPPTYKYLPGTDSYAAEPKFRNPSYCDRILYLKTSADIEGTSYWSIDCSLSDHKPVVGTYKLPIYEKM